MGHDGAVFDVGCPSQTVGLGIGAREPEVLKVCELW